LNDIERLEVKHMKTTTQNAASPLGSYPHSRRVGNLLFLSGIGSRRPGDNQIPGLELDAEGNIVKYDIEAECHSVFANVKAVLEASGSSWDKILLFLSGIGSRRPGDNQIPGLELDAEGNIVKYDIEAECHSVFANVKAVLEASGSSWDKIIDVTVFLTNMKKDFPVYNRIYADYFTSVQACRTTVEVKSLPTPIAIELKVIATID